MQITFQPVRLDTKHGDSEGLLIFRDGSLFAVASSLCSEHGELAGSLFIEATFGARERYIGLTFASQEQLAHWASTLSEASPEQSIPTITIVG